MRSSGNFVGLLAMRYTTPSSGFSRVESIEVHPREQRCSDADLVSREVQSVELHE